MADVSDHQKPKVQAVEEAIQLALAFRWADAAALNRELLERFGPDEDAQNRLGKALMELGQIDDALEAYRQTIALDPTNQIARRQLSKLQEHDLGKAASPSPQAALDIKFFTEEPGKTTLARIVGDGDGAASGVLPGDPVELVLAPGQVGVRSSRGTDIGTLEPRLAQRLRRLVDGGNRYAGAVTHVDGAAVQVLLREVYQAPALAGSVSFPIRKGREAEYRPYAKEALLVHDEEPVVISDDDDEEVSTQRPTRASAAMEEEGFGEFGELGDDDGEDQAAPDADSDDEDDDY
ncbi:MAG: tetratricopeptide repeat protein [Candidatus Dormibacteria bacterium]